MFQVDGSGDPLTLEVTVRHSFGHVMPNVLAAVTLNPAPGSVLCSCCPLLQEGLTDSSGVFVASFGKLGGHGDLSLDVTAQWGPPIPFWSIPIEFTSPDLNGSCEPPPGSATTILDLGLWAQGGAMSDYDCDSQITVIDLGIWAGGLGVSCDPAGCP